MRDLDFGPRSSVSHLLLGGRAVPTPFRLGDLWLSRARKSAAFQGLGENLLNRVCLVSDRGCPEHVGDQSG